MLVQQLPISVGISSTITEAKDVLLISLVAIVDSLTDDTVLKSTNLTILMHTRSEDARVRIFALVAAEALWRAHGGKLLGTFGFQPVVASICAIREPLTDRCSLM